MFKKLNKNIHQTSKYIPNLNLKIVLIQFDYGVARYDNFDVRFCDN